MICDRSPRPGSALCNWFVGCARLVGSVAQRGSRSRAHRSGLLATVRLGPPSTPWGCRRSTGIERQGADNPSLWQPRLCDCCTVCWSQVEWLPCAHVVSDAAHSSRARVRASNQTRWPKVEIVSQKNLPRSPSPNVAAIAARFRKRSLQPGGWEIAISRNISRDLPTTGLQSGG